MADARLSDKELAQINAAAVTREYTVKPHLGMCLLPLIQEGFLDSHNSDYRTVSGING